MWFAAATPMVGFARWVVPHVFLLTVAGCDGATAGPSVGDDLDAATQNPDGAAPNPDGATSIPDAATPPDGGGPDAPSVVPSDTDLARLVAGMPSQSLAELETNLQSETLDTGGNSGTMVTYSETVPWDPESMTLFYIGSDHNEEPHFVTWRATDNTWRREARPVWLPSGTMHGYDHSTIDLGGRRFLHRQRGRDAPIRVYDLDARTWSDGPVSPGSTCCDAAAWFPGVGLVTLGHELRVSAGGTQSFETVFDELANPDNQGFIEYNPVHDVALFGGGGGNGNPAPASPVLYVLHRDRTVERLDDAPFPLGLNHAIVTVDPVSGDFIVPNDTGALYSYDITTRSWTSLGLALPIETRNSPLDRTIGVSLSNFGVVAFIWHRRGGGKFLIYKHAD